MLRDVLRDQWKYTENGREMGEEEEKEFEQVAGFVGVQNGQSVQSIQQAFVQGLQQAHKENVLELRQLFLKIVRLRFPSALRLARRQTLGIEDTQIFRELIVRLSIAQTTEEVVIYLLEMDEDEEELEG